MVQAEARTAALSQLTRGLHQASQSLSQSRHLLDNFPAHWVSHSWAHPVRHCSTYLFWILSSQKSTQPVLCEAFLQRPSHIILETTATHLEWHDFPSCPSERLQEWQMLPEWHEAVQKGYAKRLCIALARCFFGKSILGNCLSKRESTDTLMTSLLQKHLMPSWMSFEGGCDSQTAILGRPHGFWLICF